MIVKRCIYANANKIASTNFLLTKEILFQLDLRLTSSQLDRSLLLLVSDLKRVSITLLQLIEDNH